MVTIPSTAIKFAIIFYVTTVENVNKDGNDGQKYCNIYSERKLFLFLYCTISERKCFF